MIDPYKIVPNDNDWWKATGFIIDETILKSPIDCNYNKTEIQNNNSDNIWEEEDNKW